MPVNLHDDTDDTPIDERQMHANRKRGFLANSLSCVRKPLFLYADRSASLFGQKAAAHAAGEATARVQPPDRRL